MENGSFFGLSAYHMLMAAIGAAIFAAYWLPRLLFPRGASSSSSGAASSSSLPTAPTVS